MTSTDQKQPGDMDKTYSLYMTGGLTKHQFIAAMHQYHQVLFQYSRRLRGNMVESLHITEQGLELATRNGVRFACDPGDVYGTPLVAFSFGEVERVAGDLLGRFMPEQGVFFDIGANVGWYSLHLARSRPQAQVYAFEPLPATYGWLRRNIDLNGLNNVAPFNVGLGEKEESMLFYFRPDMTGAASARNITESLTALEHACSIRRLDDCWREIGRNPDLIKCDVEGAELFVFRGGRACLAEAKPVILCEMLRKWSAKFGYTPNDIIRFLAEIGGGGGGWICLPRPGRGRPESL
jgi:FkbM family methyltransferase